MGTIDCKKVRLIAILKAICPKKITTQEALAVVNKIQEQINEYENIPFIIGKTDNPNQRDDAYDSKGYHLFEIVFSDSSLEAIDEMEKCLIRYFKIEETTADDITNVNDGGAGRRTKSSMYYIYVAIKTNNNNENN